jgi:hypothetical protein
MKRFILILLILPTLAGLAMNAQNNQRIAAEKVAFFTRRLNLSVEEAEKFWPVYNDYSNRKDKIIQDRNNLMKYAAQNKDNLSAKELDEAGDKVVEYITEEAELTRQYHEKFKEVLAPEKVVQLYYLDQQFKAYLLNQLQQRRQQQPARR